ncbi:hypothetical protein [Streptomyces sp. NPDC055287]
MAKAADLYELAWHQASQAPPSETREQRPQLKSFKDILGSRRWRNEERRQAAESPAPKAAPNPERRVLPKPRPVADPAPTRSVVWSSNPSSEPPKHRQAQTAPAVAGSRPSSRAAAPALLEPGRLWEIATELRPALEQTARAGATISWPAIRKRLSTPAGFRVLGWFFFGSGCV